MTQFRVSDVVQELDLIKEIGHDATQSLMMTQLHCTIALLG